MTADSMNVSPRNRSLGSLVGGLILIGLGLAFFFDMLNVWNFGDLIKFWPLILVGIGISKLLSPQKRDDRIGGLWLVGIGSWLLVPSLRLFGLGWGEAWPLSLIVVGTLIIVQSLFSDRGLGASS